MRMYVDTLQHCEKKKVDCHRATRQGKNTEKNGQGVREVVRRRSCAGGEGGWRACGDRMERGVQPEEWEAKVPQQIRLLLYFVDYSMYVCQQAKNALFLPVFVSFVCPTAPLQLARQHIRLC